MEDQLEEKDVLEMGAWNAEYDIAEEEEERLLEEHEMTEGKDAFPYESEANFSDTEFEPPDVEEDILDLGLNEDIIEYEEAPTNNQETSNEIKKTSTQPNQGSEASTTSQTNLTVGNSPSRDYKRSIKCGQPGSSYKQGNFKRQPNFPIPVQMRNPPPPRIGPPGFHSQRPIFDGPNRPLIGRSPSIMGFHGPRSGFGRHPHAMPMEPLFVQDFHHGLRLPAQRFPRHPFKDHHVVDHHQLMDFDRNSNANRLFINPHYQGSVTIQNGCTSRITPLTEPRLSFSSSDNAPPRLAFQNRHQLPPPGPNLANGPRPASYPSMRFAPPVQSSLPPPRSNGPTDQVSPTRFKPPPPQNLMDMILPTPFGEGPLRPQYHPEHPRPQRFRFNSFDPPPHSYDATLPVRFLTPPPVGSKRPAAAEVTVTAPLKQLRLGPTGNIQVLRTFPPPSVSLNSPPPSVGASVLPSVSASLRLGPPPIVRPQHLPAPFGKPHQITDSPRSTSVTATTVSTATTTSSPAPLMFQSSSASTSTSISNNTEDASPEMKEYLEKMEEQRKKREEVLRMKEERRRQKLESLAGKDNFSTEAISKQPGNTSDGIGSTSTMVSPTSRTLDINKPNTNVVVNQSSFSRLNRDSSCTQAGSVDVKENSVSPTLRKTVLVKPTPTVPAQARVIPQAAIGVNRRYKIIIVKNKSGKILEKRRVPIDESPSGSNQDNPSCHVAQVSPITSVTGQNSARISETVTIENLSINATEEYVWKLCQLFGSVQEVYPKLQEGKAIVRFSSSFGANNFLSNHNTPGICVRFL